MQRLEWKEKIIAEFNELKDQKPLSLSMGKMKYPNIDEFTKVITLGTVDRSKKIFFPAKTLNGISGVRIASLLSDNHGNNYLIDEGWFEQSRYDYFKENKNDFNLTNANYINYIKFPADLKERYQPYTESNNENIKSIGYENDFYNLKDGINKYLKYLDNK